MRARLGPRGTAALWAGKLTAARSRGLRRGGGTTLPGDVARWIDPRILTKLSRSLAEGTVVITGTNGKTTTAALLRHILEAQGRQAVANQAGANLIFGVTAAIVNQTSWSKTLPADVGHVGRYRCPRGDFARPSPDIKATAISIEGMERMRLRVSDGAQTADVDVPLSGLYNAYNIIMALAAAKAMRVPLAKSAAALH